MSELPFSQHADHATGFLLWQVNALWQRQVAAALKPYGLTQVQFALLASILWLSRVDSQLTQVRIARHAKLDVMMTSQVLRTLEQRGLIERDEHPSDTRAKIITLTPLGIERAHLAIPVVERVDDTFFGIFKKDQQTLNALFVKLIERH